MKECSVCHRCLENDPTFCPDDGAPLDDVFPGPATLDAKYRLLSCLGRGGMGRVYKARHLGLKRFVAVKLLDPDHSDDPGFVSRFEREAEILGRLEHPSIVAVSDFGLEPARQLSYLVMEYLEGAPLDERLASGGLLDLETALGIFDAVASALDHAHAHGVVHRDLKPGNVFLVDTQGTAPTVKILDFGLSRFFADLDATTVLAGGRPPADGGTTDDRLTAPGTVMGSPGYVAPELLRAERATPASDLYSLGALIHRVLTGRVPEGDLAPELVGPLRAALDPEPSRRPPTAGYVVAELRRAACRLGRRRQRPRWLTTAAFVGLLAVLLGARRAERLFRAAARRDSLPYGLP